MAAGHEGRRVQIRDPHAYRELGVIWRQGQSLAPAATAFLDMLRRSADFEARDGVVARPPAVETGRHRTSVPR
jgi:DNA-binding transcriptional LysR family regulator